MRRIKILFIIVFFGLLFACQKKYQVTIDYNNIIDNVTYNLKKGEVITKPDRPLKEGYVFDNWYKDSSYSTEYEFDTKISSNITIYGKFEKVKLELNNPNGFATLAVSNRINIPSENIYEINDEVDFLDAMYQTENKENVIFKINKDLDMGYNVVLDKLKKANKSEALIKEYTDGSFYKENSNKPLMHPTLIESGVGQLIIQGRKGLMIYSETGNEIKHLTTSIKGNSSDIVIRNLKFSEIWEWDENDLGAYKLNDWDYFTVEKTDGIWFDHLTFKNSYDGIIDMKANATNVTMSWLNLDFTPDDFIKTQINYLEENREEKDEEGNLKYPFYDVVRKHLSVDEIITICGSQKKGFNLGNTTDGQGFETITVTMHHIYAKNLQDRFPRLRKGDVHFYNVVLDCTDLTEVREKIVKLKAGYVVTNEEILNVVNQGIVPTENGAVLMENSSFYDVAEPVKTHQDSIISRNYTGRYLIKNSKYVYNDIDGDDDISYVGSSTEKDKWQKSNTNVSWDLDFYFRNYQELPYEYKMDNLEDFEDILKTNLLGAGTIEDFNWLDIIGQIDSDMLERGNRIDDSLDNLLSDQFISINSPIKLPEPELYNFYGDKEKLKKDVDYTVTIEHTIDPAKEGIYPVKYTISSTHTDQVIKDSIYYYVYDENGANMIVKINSDSEFDGILNLDITSVTDNGKLYYLMTNRNDVTTIEQIEDNPDLKSVDIDSVYTSVKDLKSRDYRYIYAYTYNNEKYSNLTKLFIPKEEIINIESEQQFIEEVLQLESLHKYYVLTKDLDFTGYTLDPEISNIPFEGILDGNGYTIKNFTNDSNTGLFQSINKGIMRNIIFENINLSYEKDNLGFFGKSEGNSKIYNITFKNCNIESYQYPALLVGQIVKGTLEISNIKVENCNVKANKKYGGLLVGQTAAETKLVVNDVFIDNCFIDATEDMGAFIVSRPSGKVEVNRVVILNSKIKAVKNIGGIIGKLDGNSSAVIKDVFVYYTYENYDANSYLSGNIIGNVNASNNRPYSIENGFAVKTIEGSKFVIDATLIEDITTINETWWQTNLANIANSDLWILKDNMYVLK